MLSICIPTYNYDITHLIRKLHQQLIIVEQEVEIIIIDDGSSEHFREINKGVAKLSNVRYYEQENQGRAITRNTLAELSHYQYIAFIDCDCDVKNDFIAKYIKALQPDTVLVGGLLYPEKPKDKKLQLRWKVGVKKEVKSLNERILNPYSNFLSSNFVVPTQLMKGGGFDSKLSAYGHEDTMFGLWLMNNNFNIKHIQNPVIHLGLDTAKDYLKKLQQSTQNLLIIHKSQPSINEIKLLVFYRRMKKLRIESYFCMIFENLKPWLEAYFTKGHTSLILLDIYKLGLFCSIINKHKEQTI